MKLYFKLIAIIFAAEYGFGDLLTTYLNFLKYGWSRETDRATVMIWEGGGWFALIEVKILYIAAFTAACYLGDWALAHPKIAGDISPKVVKTALAISAMLGIFITANNLIALVL